MALVGKGAVGVGTGRRKKREEDERKTARSVRREQAERKKRREQAERKKIAPPGYRLPDYEPKAPKPQVYEPPVPLARPPMQNLGVGAPAVEYRPPSVELQLKNLTTAYYKLHDSFPTAPQALILLNTAPGFPRTVKEWEEFLAPGVKSGELPQPGDVETEAMRVDDLDVIGRSGFGSGGSGRCASNHGKCHCYTQHNSNQFFHVRSSCFLLSAVMSRELKELNAWLSFS